MQASIERILTQGGQPVTWDTNKLHTSLWKLVILSKSFDMISPPTWPFLLVIHDDLIHPNIGMDLTFEG